MDRKVDKSRIFIASSGRTLVLAEKLRDELRTEFCEPRLWSQESKLQPGATIIEMLEGAIEQFDFAVIVLAKDDVMSGGRGETLKARDNCVFEAGLFMAAIGRKRCFLVNSVSQADLPTDLSGIISIPFKEPADLGDRDACEQAISIVAATLKDAMQRKGPFAYHGRLPLLSVEDLFGRERPLSERGDLNEDRVIVVDVQPAADIEQGELVRHNLDSGNGYHYLCYFSDNTVEKICQLLQVIAWAGLNGAASASDFETRLVTIENNKDRVLEALRYFCQNGKLRFTLMLTEVTLCFRIHNATNPALARYYVKRLDSEKRSVQYALWAEGQDAVAVWRVLPDYLEDDKDDRLFIPLKYPAFSEEHKQHLENSLSRSLSRYFHGMESEVKDICLGIN